MKSNLLYVLICCLVSSTLTSAQTQTVTPFEIGSPTLQEIWVSSSSGNDSNSGNSASEPLETITAAWNKIPTGNLSSTGYRINIRAGNYPESSIPNYWENKRGTLQYPIILTQADGVGTAVLQGDINAFNLRYFYLLGLKIEPHGDAFHCEQCEHILIRNSTLDGGNLEAHETIKVNQSEHIYIESSAIRGADDNAIDFVAVQYGHVINSRISRAQDWCAYFKGGSAYITFANNVVHDCGTGGVTAGQGSGLEFMTAPWIRYEAYSIKIFNNIIHDTEGAGIGVNGGAEVLIAYNTLYRIGSRSHLVESVFGERSCDGNNTECAARIAQGGWGPTSNAIDPQPIPNRSVYIYNNIFYNPAGFESQWQHIAVYGARTAAGGTNIPNPVAVDNDLRIAGNVFWNGSVSKAIGVGDDQGCQDSNATCNTAQLTADNLFNTLEPQLQDPENEHFMPTASSNILSISGVAIPAFDGSVHAEAPVTAAGNTVNEIDLDIAGRSRGVGFPPGAFTTYDGDLPPGVPDDDNPESDTTAPDISNYSMTPANQVVAGRKLLVQADISDDTGVTVAFVRVAGQRKNLRLSSGNSYRARIKLSAIGRYRVVIKARDAAGNRSSQFLGFIKVKPGS